MNPSLLRDLVGEVAADLFDDLPSSAALSLLEWIAALRRLSDRELTGEAMAALAQLRLPEFLNPGREVDEFKREATQFEATRRHLALGHHSGCGTSTMFEVALHQVTQGRQILGACACWRASVEPAPWSPEEERSTLMALRKRLQRSRRKGHGV